MAFKKEIDTEQANTCNLSIDEDITIYTIETLKQSLSDEIDQYQHFNLSLQNVEEFDSAGVQLLLAFNSELASKQKTLQISHISSQVNKLLNDYELIDRFNLGNTP